MGLFDKKQCSICGNDIGLLGNRKLSDGNLCKNCAAKLSPWFSDRRSSTVEQIRQQLAYREQNERNLASFNPTRVIDGMTKIYFDEAQKKFIVTRTTNWRSSNPDLISTSQVQAVELDISEDKDEVYKDTENKVSYDPPKYEYEYTFNIHLAINSPYFDEIDFELRDTRRSEGKDDETYVTLMNRAYEIQHLLKPELYPEKKYEPEKTETETAEEKKDETLTDGQWKCSCGHVNAAEANFCSACGSPKPLRWFCPECGKENTGKFCIACGHAIPEEYAKKITR